MNQAQIWKIQALVGNGGFIVHRRRDVLSISIDKHVEEK